MRRRWRGAIWIGLAASLAAALALPADAVPAQSEVEAMRVFALGLVRAGRYDAAVEAYRTLAQQLPDDARAHADLAGTLAWLRRYAEAEQPARRAARLDPEQAEVHALLASVLFNLGQERDALRATMRGAELGDATAMWELYVCYERGRGTEVDPERGLEWAERAAR